VLKGKAKRPETSTEKGGRNGWCPVFQDGGETTIHVPGREIKHSSEKKKKKGEEGEKKKNSFIPGVWPSKSLTLLARKKNSVGSLFHAVKEEEGNCVFAPTEK